MASRRNKNSDFTLVEDYSLDDSSLEQVSHETLIELDTYEAIQAEPEPDEPNFIPTSESLEATKVIVEQKPVVAQKTSATPPPPLRKPPIPTPRSPRNIPKFSRLAK